jgi:hypothetical protein
MNTFGGQIGRNWGKLARADKKNDPEQIKKGPPKHINKSLPAPPLSVKKKQNVDHNLSKF